MALSLMGGQGSGVAVGSDVGWSVGAGGEGSVLPRSTGVGELGPSEAHPSKASVTRMTGANVCKIRSMFLLGNG